MLLTVGIVEGEVADLASEYAPPSICTVGKIQVDSQFLIEEGVWNTLFKTLLAKEE